MLPFGLTFEYVFAEHVAVCFPSLIYRLASVDMEKLQSPEEAADERFQA